MPNSKLHHIESNQLWPDFHATFINYWREEIAERLPKHYQARIGEQISLIRSGEDRRYGPDISVVRSQSSTYFGRSQENRDTTVATLDHLRFKEELRQTRIEIVHRPNKQVVTMIELLSPSNKVEPGWTRYLDKRADLLLQPIHLIELDLLQVGHRLPHQQPLPEGEYFCFLTRVEKRTQCSVFAWQGETQLPIIPIPLLSPDTDIASDLQSVMQWAYTRGRYDA